MTECSRELRTVCPPINLRRTLVVLSVMTCKLLFSSNFPAGGTGGGLSEKTLTLMFRPQLFNSGKLRKPRSEELFGMCFPASFGRTSEALSEMTPRLVFPKIFFGGTSADVSEKTYILAFRLVHLRELQHCCP